MHRRHAYRAGRRITFTDTGRGPTTVTVLHPVGLDADWWAEETRRLGDGYRVIAVDLAGHGGTDADTPLTFAGMAADVEAVWHTAGTEASIVVGVSMGGMVAQQLALSSDVVTGLVPVCTAATLEPPERAAIRARAAAVDELGMSELAEVTIRRWFSPDLIAHGDSRVEAARQQLAAADPDVHRDCWSVIADLDFERELAAVAVPTVIVAGDRDASLPPRHAHRLAAALTASSVLVIEGGSHMLAFERQGWLRPVLERVSGR